MAGKEAGATDDRNITLAKIYNLIASVVQTSENELNSAINKLSGKEDLGQQQLLSLQAKIQAWGNLVSTCTGMLRGVGDALKATTQNIR